MRSFIDKFSARTSRFEPLFLIIPFILWIFCFRHFFSGHLSLEADAISYADHIGFYITQLSRGVFPLWDPTWYGGAPNDFFLRRIGDLNPLLFLIVVLKWLGFSSANAYLVFLGFYYFLAGWAFYLIARLLFVDRFFAFSSYILLLFSSWGCEIFYNYIIIIFVPIIWFFYFLLSFACKPRQSCFLGACLCLGLIVTTYIPFFFLTILFIFTLLYLLFYGKECAVFLKGCLLFFKANRVFTVFCIVFLLISCVPGLLFYQETKSGEFVLPNRHAGADISSAVAVGLDNVMSGDIISHGYFDRIFDDHAHLDLGDIYLPYLFFLILLSTIAARVNKLIFFLLFNILGLGLITVTSAAGVHRFLYEHIIFFKFIRNIYYFFWLAMLPMAVLLSVAALKSLLTAIDHSSRKTAWLIYIIGCHVLFGAFLWGHQGILGGAWAGIFISLSYFLVCFYSEKKTAYLAGFIFFLLAVFIQSAQVYEWQSKEIYHIQHNATDQGQAMGSPIKTKMNLYYAARWFTVLVDYTDPQVLDNYMRHPFIFYDNVVPYSENPEFFKALQAIMAEGTNVAFVSKSESDANNWKSDPAGNHLADLDPVSSGELSVVHADANTWVLKAHLPSERFLVVNDNYNSDWHAFINGHKARLFRANLAFKGLWVPSGDSRIVLRFSSPGSYAFHWALMALFAAVFIYLLVLL